MSFFQKVVEGKERAPVEGGEVFKYLAKAVLQGNRLIED
jgi:hypothetical protein